MYHRIAPVEDDVWGLSVEPERFAAQLDVLGRHTEVVPLAALASEEGGLRSAVTFDDGYADNAEIGREILRAAGSPATVFIVAGMVGGHEFWWDRAARLVQSGVSSAGRVELEIGNEAVSIDLTTAADRKEGVRAVCGRLQGLQPAEIESALDVLSTRLDADDAQPRHRIVQPEELAELAAGDLIEVGSHTVSHAQLSTRSPAEKRHEIFDSRKQLEQMTGRPVTSFSYPYGDYDEAAVRLVGEAGYTQACTNEPGRVSDSTSPLRLPRRKCLNWSREEFAERLAGWISG
jgi:peptidoglycan/xylan/chitin deacetylase (PgdA/CDA1 family)